jgi:hypothetical protein
MSSADDQPQSAGTVFSRRQINQQAAEMIHSAACHRHPVCLPGGSGNDCPAPEIIRPGIARIDEPHPDAPAQRVEE